MFFFGLKISDPQNLIECLEMQLDHVFEASEEKNKFQEPK